MVRREKQVVVVEERGGRGGGWWKEVGGGRGGEEEVDLLWTWGGGGGGPSLDVGGRWTECRLFEGCLCLLLLGKKAHVVGSNGSTILLLPPPAPYNTQVFKILAALANRTTLNMDAIDDGQTDADALDNLDKILAIPLNLNYEFEIDDLIIPPSAPPLMATVREARKAKESPRKSGRD